MIKRLYILAFLAFTFQMTFAYDCSKLLNKLDSELENSQAYCNVRKDCIDSIKDAIATSDIGEQKLLLLGDLFEQYKGYNIDSLFVCAQVRYETALQINHPFFLQASEMNKIEAMTIAGMYKEACDAIKQMNAESIDDNLKPYFFHLSHTLYYLMAENASDHALKHFYKENSIRYADSILTVNPQTSFTYAIVSSEKEKANLHYSKALTILENYEKSNALSESEKAIIAYCKADAYDQKGDNDNAEYFYIISAIHDVQTGTREYESLRKLALLLYNRGDVQHAYQYIRISMKDAVFCKSTFRTTETANIFPIIENAYQEELQLRQKQQFFFTLSIGILAILLIIALAFVYRQMKKVSALRMETANMNLLLQNFNDELQKTNQELSFSNKVKEEYVGRYMDLCSAYIEKLDNFRREMNRAKRENDTADLLKILSPKAIEKELNEFYDNFDNSFLTIFPDFVEKFNALLQENEAIILKSGERLNTDLRVYALIRLGISDSAKIAQFLRYSPSTIYNCRVKIRNKARVNRAEFEQKVMEIQ